jgi:hypothetical protein
MAVAKVDRTHKPVAETSWLWITLWAHGRIGYQNNISKFKVQISKKKKNHKIE